MTEDEPPPRGAALVTGAARGIGAAVVARLAARGQHVYALDLSVGGETAGTGASYGLGSPAELEAVAAAHPGLVTPVVADARDLDALRAVAARARTEHGGLSVVVAGAAVVAGGAALWETDEQVLDDLWRADLLTVWRTATATVPLLLEQPADARPTFVALASVAGRTGLFHLSAYVVVKHAVVGLVRGLAADLVGTGVTAVGVCPGSTDTAMLRATAALYGLDDVGPLVAEQAARRALHPDEVASVVEHAATAGPVLHGAVLDASGGFGT